MASSIFVLRLLMYVLVFQKLRSETNLLQKVTAPFSVALLISLFLSLLQIFHGRTIGGMFYFLGERTFSTTTPGIALFDSAGQLFLRPYATFPHPNVLSGFSLLVLAILLFKPKKRTIEYLGILSAIMLILLSASEGALIALLLLGAYLAVRKQVGIDLSVVMIISFVMASFLQLYIAPSIINMDLPEQFTKRAELVLIAREYILSNPLSGVGGGAFVTDLPNQWEKSSYLETSFSWFLQPVHNIPLLLVSEWGVLIAACLLFCVFYSLKNVSNKHLFVSGLIVTFATGFIDHYWVTIGQTRLVLVIWLALVFSKNSATMQNRNDKKN